MKIFTVFVLSCLCSGAVAQSLSSQFIGTGGSFSSNTIGSLSATIGEPLAGDRINGLILHQGFQVNVIITETPVTAVEDLLVNVTVYPNPFVSKLTILVEEQREAYHYQLVDGSGKTILPETSLTATSELDMRELKPAVYFLILRHTSGKTKTVSILKNH